MKDSVIKFFEVVRQDEKLTERLRAVGDKIEEFSRLACELGRQRGFVFEPKDVEETLKALVSQKQGELTEEQLSAIAAGAAGTGAYACFATLTLLQTAGCVPGGVPSFSNGCAGGLIIRTS